MVDKKTAIECVAKNIREFFDRHFAHRARVDELLDKLASLSQAALFVDKESHLRPIAKLGPLLEKKLDQIRILFKKSEIFADGQPQPVNWRLSQVSHRLTIKMLMQALHAPVYSSEEKLLLGGKFAVNSGFAY